MATHWGVTITGVLADGTVVLKATGNISVPDTPTTPPEPPPDPVGPSQPIYTPPPVVAPHKK